MNMKLLAVLIVLAVSCTEALLRRQLSPETGVGKLTPEQRTVGINDQKTKETKKVAEVGKLTPEQRTVGINDQKTKETKKVAEVGKLTPSINNDQKKVVKPAAVNKGGKPSPGSSDKKKEVTPAVDICETELNAAGDFPNKLGYTPTPACCENTMYVQARKSSKGFISKDAKCKDAGAMAAKSTSAMFVIDMQNDFTTGSFKLPCEGPRKNKLAKAIAAKMIAFANAGGLVVLSKDYHPVDHCSFMKIGDGGIPEEKKGCKDDDHKNTKECECRNTLEGSLESNVIEARYKNKFPAHTVKHTNGSQFDPIIAEAVKTITASAVEGRNVRRPVVIYKGFAPLYDSFSAFPHVTVSNPSKPGEKAYADRERLVTGGWATSRYNTTTPENICVVSAPDDTEISNHLSKPQAAKVGGLVSVNKIMKDNKIAHIYVTGLVFDYCVKETSLFALANAANGDNDIKSVSLIADLAAPAMEGKPGLLGPLATKPYLEGVAKELNDKGVCVVETTKQTTAQQVKQVKVQQVKV